LDGKLAAVTEKLDTCKSRLSDYERLLEVLKRKSGNKIRHKIRKAERNMTTRAKAGPSFAKQKYNVNYRPSVQQKGRMEKSNRDNLTSSEKLDIKELVQTVDKFLEEFTNELESHPCLKKSELKGAAARFIEESLSGSFDKITCKRSSLVLDPTKCANLGGNSIRLVSVA